MSVTRVFQTLVVRELLTVARNRVTLVLLGGVTMVVFGMLFAGGTPEVGYVPAALDLLTPLEFVVPAVAVALGYRAIVDDARRGELEVLDTYPVPSWVYVAGIFVGRALPLLVVVGLPLVAAMAYLSTVSPPDPATLATHRGIDSPLLFVRFLLLTLLYGLVVLALSLLVSAIAWSRRTAIGLAIIALGLVVVGIDLVLLRGVGAEWIAANQLTTLLALSPGSAYRGLVFETVLYVALDAESGFAAPLASVLGLGGWLVGSLALTTVALSWRREQ